MFSRLTSTCLKSQLVATSRALGHQATASPVKTKRPCGKCVRCSCKDNVQPAAVASGISSAKREHSTVAIPKTPISTFGSTEGLPLWIKDPTSPKGLAAEHVLANNANDKRWLEVVWNDGSTTQHPYLWLRDNCPCPECFHPTTLSRRFLMKNLDTDVIPVDTKVDRADQNIRLTWSDGHVSDYPFAWLEGRSFTERSRQQRDKWLPREHKYWGAEMQGQIPTAAFDNIMSDDKALYEWINSLEQTGLFRIQGAPQNEGVLTEFAKRIGFLKTTHFGDLWEVRTRANPSNLQYTTATLGLHIDLTYYDYTPGVQLLHCIKQAKSEGGDNQFVDGFHIAQRMREEHPEHFKLLTEVLMDHYDLGEETNGSKFFKLQRQPVIRFDRYGKFDRITYNNMVRDNVLCAPVELVNPLYKAMKVFDDMLHDPSNHVVNKMEPGDITCFHNYRILHGRSGYRQLEAGDRFLQGGFLDWDEMYCKRRVLQMMLDLN